MSIPDTLADTDVGRNGFNRGDTYIASPDAGAAVLNINICTAMSMLVWTVLDLTFFKKPSVIGAVQGIITGLVAITPASRLRWRLRRHHYWRLLRNQPMVVHEHPWQTKVVS